MSTYNEVITLKTYPEEMPIDIFVGSISHYYPTSVCSDMIVSLYTKYGKEILIASNMREIRENLTNSTRY